MSDPDIAFHPLADIFPMMEDAALAELAADIKAHGLRETIKLWEGAILDGRNRYLACQLAGVEPVLKALEFPGGEQQALAYVLSRNLKRRHLNVVQRSLVAVKVANMRKGARTDLQPRAKLPEVSLAAAAEMLNVSRRSVVDAKVVLNSDDAEFIAAVEAGRASLHKAADTVRRERRPVEAIQGRAESPRPPKAPDDDEDAVVRQIAARAAELSNPAIVRLLLALSVKLPFAEQENLRRGWRALPKLVVIGDVLGWVVTALDSELLRVADAAFNRIRSVPERLKHDETVKAWLDQHERENPDHEPWTDAATEGAEP